MGSWFVFLYLICTKELTAKQGLYRQKSVFVGEAICIQHLQPLLLAIHRLPTILFLLKQEYFQRKLVCISHSLSWKDTSNVKKLFSVLGQKSIKYGNNIKVELLYATCLTKLTYLALPIISVCPVQLPRLDSSNKKYSFKQEKELMRDKIRTALRIAVYYGYSQICISSFGLGPRFRNPTEEVANMWKDAFLNDPEFDGHFRDIVFAFDAPETGSAGSSSSLFKGNGKGKASPLSSSSSHFTGSSSQSSSKSDLAVFQHTFNPAVIHNAYR